jgi:hypothetical protein
MFFDILIVVELSIELIKLGGKEGVCWSVPNKKGSADGLCRALYFLGCGEMF